MEIYQYLTLSHLDRALFNGTKYSYVFFHLLHFFSDYALALQYNGSFSEWPYVSRLTTPTIQTVGSHCFSFEYTTINSVQAYLSLANGTCMTVFDDSYTNISFVDWKKAYVTLQIDLPGAYLMIAGTKPRDSEQQYILVVENVRINQTTCANLQIPGKVESRLDLFLFNL